ncbi:TPA: hypothetical protein DCP76_00500, partial [Patescibacteria group bacterium]|nr:hypothetical protein [Patescibacteria group bacterium]
MIDIKKIVEETDVVKQGLLKRMDEDKLDLNGIIALYKKRKQIQTQYDNKRGEQNGFNEQMSKVEKGSDEFKKLIADLKAKSEEVKALEVELKNAEAELKAKMEVLPNIPEEDVVAGGKENNEVIKMVGEKP